MIETYKLLHDKYYEEYSQLVKLHASHIYPERGRGAGLDIGLWQPLARGASESENPLAPPKTCNDPNVFAAGIYDFTREVANFCTLGLYITKNKYELTLPSEFCRFQSSGQWKINCGGPNWPDSLKKASGTAGT